MNHTRPRAARRGQIAVLRASAYRFLAGRGDGVGGLAAIELGLIAPILALMLVATFDFGMGIYRAMQVESAAQAGAQYAIGHGFSGQNQSSITAAVTGSTTYSGISASPAPSRFCGCASSSGVTTATCSSICSDGTVAGTYVTVSAKATYAPTLSYPLIPSSFNLSAQSTVRIQ